MQYIKNNLSLISITFKETFSQPVILTTLYLFVIYMVGVYAIHIAGTLDINHALQPAILAFLKYMFTLVFPIASIILLNKSKKTGGFFKHLKFIFYPLIKFEMIMYALFSLLIIILSFSIFIKINPIFVDTFNLWSQAASSGDFNDIESITNHILETKPELLTNLSIHLETFQFYFSFALLLAVLILSTAFFINTVKILLNENLGFIANMKKSYAEFKKYILAIIIMILISLFAINIYTPTDDSSTTAILLNLLFGNLVLITFFNFLIILSSNKEEKGIQNDDIYNVEIKD